MLACPLPTHASPGLSAIKLVLMASYHPTREPQGLLWWLQPLQYIELHRDSAGASASRTGTGRLCASRRKIN